MKILLNEQDKKKLDTLLNVKDTNIALADFFNDLIDNKEYFPEFNKEISSSNKIKNLIIDHCEMKEYENVFNEYCKDSFSYTDFDEYNKNPYKIAVKPTPFKEKGYSLEYLSYPEKTFFPLDDITVIDNFKEVSKLAISDTEYKYLAVLNNNRIWMCITPNEINTMAPAISEAKGNVITFGLGLGYFPFMCSLKKEVSKITIIERDQTIINIFTNHLLPFFPNKEKINIVKADAFDLLKRDNLSRYDYSFFDMWHNANDGLPLYLRIANYHIKCNTGFWLETSIIALGRRYLLTLIEESLSGFKDKDYLNVKNNDDRILKTLYFKAKDLVIKNSTELVEFLSNINIKKLLRN